jgi:hypothetical protein
MTTGSEPRRTFTLVAGRWRANGLTWEVVDAPVPTERERVEVQEVVGSGHDEQTEDLIRDLAHYSGPVTVAVMAAFCARAQAIEERFKPSAPGGEKHG